jgi:hypothetical protein
LVDALLHDSEGRAAGSWAVYLTQYGDLCCVARCMMEMLLEARTKAFLFSADPARAVGLQGSYTAVAGGRNRPGGKAYRSTTNKLLGL